MRLRPISWSRLTGELADRIERLTPADGGAWPRIALDGAPAAHPEQLAADLAAELRLRGRPVQRVRSRSFLRSASLRLEYGHQDADAYYDRWLDDDALFREVFTPLDPGGTGRVLPDLRDPVTDRSTRSPYVELAPGTVLLLDGQLLLGRWFPFDLAVHLRMSEPALRRRTEEGERWTLPAFARYEAEVRPDEAADILVRADDPAHPAWNQD
ncbi:uridine kinase [Kitasatospora sp. NBC_01287]|uniref:uridine kinase n=1 Tax=Kitasatospora sp. NBC_01287 TaxID=2903573 RepID=UPI002258CD85|nr:uridine kinase [Kitasatospora sp. NBC_01287]MCX4749369.1 uridine kinase [Kitasatospora sp. NBC_01287]